MKKVKKDQGLSSSLDHESFARSVLDSQIARIAVIDCNGKIIAVNEPWRRFATENGAGPDTVHGVGIDYFATAGASGDPDVQKALDGIREVLKGTREVFSQEYCFDIPEGKFWFEMFVTPLRMPQGGAVIAHQSIDERKRAELLILQQRAHLNAIFQGADEGIFAIASSGHIARINDPALKMLGLKREQAIGKTFASLIGGELADLDTHVRSSLHKGKSTRDLSLEVDLPVGFRVFLCNVRPLEVEGLDYYEALVVIRDISRLYALQREVEDQRSFGDLIGKSVRLREVNNLIIKVAPSKTTVLLLGESGTGKGIIASLVHKYSERKDGPFVAVNCAALSDTLLQSELFGHVRGAFTGAVNDRIGRFQRAHGGTIFLDEIGDISPAVQVTLLRVLEEKQFEKLGDARTLTADARVIAATNRNLYAQVQEGHFREDLFYRLNVVTIHIPPLRDRKEDIPLLADHFRIQFNRELGTRVEKISAETIHILQEHNWPGNVRELRNAIERAFIMSRGPVLLPEHLPREEVQKHTPSGRSYTTSPAISPPLPVPFPVRRKIDREILEATLQQWSWNIVHAARALGVTRQYIYYLLKKFNLSRPEQYGQGDV